jgi:hypothetical protein
MAGITLAQAEARLAGYLAAEEAVLAGQSVQMDGRALTLANLALIQAGIELWDARVKNLSQASAGRGRARTLSPNW